MTMVMNATNTLFSIEQLSVGCVLKASLWFSACSSLSKTATCSDLNSKDLLDGTLGQNGTA